MTQNENKVLIVFESVYSCNDEVIFKELQNSLVDKTNISWKINTFSDLDLEQRIFNNKLNESSIAILEWMENFFHYCNEMFFNLKESVVVTNISFFKILNIINYMSAMGHFTPFVRDYLCNRFDEYKESLVKKIDRSIEYIYLNFPFDFLQNHFLDRETLEKIKIFHPFEMTKSRKIHTLTNKEKVLFDLKLLFKYMLL